MLQLIGNWYTIAIAVPTVCVLSTLQFAIGCFSLNIPINTIGNCDTAYCNNSENLNPLYLSENVVVYYDNYGSTRYSPTSSVIPKLSNFT